MVVPSAADLAITPMKPITTPFVLAPPSGHVSQPVKSLPIAAEPELDAEVALRRSLLRANLHPDFSGSGRSWSASLAPGSSFAYADSFDEATTRFAPRLPCSDQRPELLSPNWSRPFWGSGPGCRWWRSSVQA